jgi:hypothetical protein
MVCSSRIFFFVDNRTVFSEARPGRTGDGGMNADGVQRLLFPAFVLSMGVDRQTAKLPVCLPTVPGLMRGACAVVV